MRLSRKFFSNSAAILHRHHTSPSPLHSTSSFPHSPHAIPVIALHSLMPLLNTFTYTWYCSPLYSTPPPPPPHIHSLHSTYFHIHCYTNTTFPTHTVSPNPLPPPSLPLFILGTTTPLTNTPGSSPSPPSLLACSLHPSSLFTTHHTHRLLVYCLVLHICFIFLFHQHDICPRKASII